MRNYGRKDQDHGPSVLLKVRKGVRVARCGKRPIVAYVSLGYATHNSCGTYRHPTIEFRSPDADGSCIGGIRVEMRFQSHIAGSTDCGSDARLGKVRGFMRPDYSTWVGCYGAQLRGDFSYSGHGREIVQIIRLVERARKAQPRDSKCNNCDLLALIVGLRRCGVEIRVWSGYLDTLRSNRRPAAPRPADSLAHAA